MQLRHVLLCALFTACITASGPGTGSSRSATTIQTCATNADCPTGETCVDDKTGDPVCVGDGDNQPPTPCATNADCLADQECVADLCQYVKTQGQACSSAADCANGQQCDAGVCEDIEPPPTPCTTDADCLTGEQCVSNVCEYVKN